MTNTGTKSLRRRAQRQLQRWTSRNDFYPRLEFAAVIAVLAIGWSSYALLTGGAAPANGVSPPLVAALVVANLLPLMVLVVLIARRGAILLANRRRGLIGAQMHVRMVGLFAGIAAVPTVLVVIFASLLFQFGVQFWFSDRVKTILDSSNRVAQAYVDENRRRVASDIVPMAYDIENYASEYGLDSKKFAEGLQYQLLNRNLSEAAVFSRRPDGQLALVAASGISGPTVMQRLAGIDLSKARAGVGIAVPKGTDRIEGIVATSPEARTFVYVTRKVDPAVLARAEQAASALGDYRSLLERSRVMQLRFNLVLIGMSLLTLVVAIWFALWLANRLVAPIARLALAAQRVGAGDLDARVPERGGPDEISTLAKAFNHMTSQLKTQQKALIGANLELDERRVFTEAVLSGVSAGVLSIAPNGIVRIANRSAAGLLETSVADLSGQSLSIVVPELAAMLEAARISGDAQGQVHIGRGSETQTLSVTIAAEHGDDHGGEGGFVLTFDDISAQLADQRRAAWADVARRIAHEIKNPLTPIQLAAERLQRKFGRQIVEDAEVFGVLTATIVRQVGDLRRMVDEFSDFARLPKPIFSDESLEKIARQTLVLPEVAFPAIDFQLVSEGESHLVCDRDQVARAIANLIKNAAESVSARLESDVAAGSVHRPGRITLHIIESADMLSLEVNDNGAGLPVESRDRLTEPYVTTRTRGTGLGLAIVKKIVEDHGGSLDLGDAPAGGAIVRASFSKRIALSDTLGEPRQRMIARG